MAESAVVVVVGCGSVGLALAVALASVGRRVLGVDVDAERVAALNAGRPGIVDEGMADALGRGLESGRLRFADGPEAGDAARAFVIAVPTPADEGGFDAGPLENAMAAVTDVAAAGDLVCIRSTVPVGTTRALGAQAPHLAFAACPDRTLAGRAFREQFETAHLVGGLDAAAGDLAEALLAPLGRVVRTTSPETAETIKLFANVERDVTFALANQFALVCEAVGVDMAEVRRAGADGFPRFQLARPGPVGGPCLTKDLHVLAASPALGGAPLALLQAARRLNESLASHVAAEILALASPEPVAVLGLGFKGSPPTGDARNGFGGLLVEALKAARPAMDIRTWDPVLEPVAEARAAALAGAAVVVLANDHPALANVADFGGRVAPRAVLYDATGLVTEAPPGMRVRRLGDGAR